MPEEAQALPRCWAHVLGDCDDKTSREHIISAGIFSDGLVKVKGLPWCKDGFVEIGLPNLTRKVLCVRHNNGTSDVDDGGIHAMQQFREGLVLEKTRQSMKPRIWNIIEMTVDGKLLERWFTKTLI